MRNLVIVESPAKSKTVGRYLNAQSNKIESEKQEYEILATGGHILESDGIDVDNDFRLNYELIPKKQQNVTAIVKAMRKAQRLYLATDPDREGEAISAHVQNVLEDRGVLKGKPVHRVVFHEVTGEAIRNAISDPGVISHDLVQAQQSRDALDILVGFSLSPLLIRKLRTSHLSAGRVQSPALRLIVERQREIEEFQPQEYWSIKANLKPATNNSRESSGSISAMLTHLDGAKLGKFDIPNESSATEAVERIRSELSGQNDGLEISVLKVETKQRSRKPLPPFTTSTMMQEAARKLGMSAKVAASVSQSLYEGLPVNGVQTGLITYTRTDSVTLSGQAIGQIRNFIDDRFGSDEVPNRPKQYRTRSKNAQEAHEAIRPTDISRTPERIASSLNKDQLRLYRLIWQRAVACQMNDAVYDETGVVFGTEANKFRATGSSLRKPGWLAVYPRDDDEEKVAANRSLTSLSEGDRLSVLDILPQQHFTEPPPRYNTASLVRKLEEYGIGRPSTWPSIIAKLLERNYVTMSGNSFIASSLGCVVIDYLVDHFNQYIDYQFTSDLEDGLDAVARGERKRSELLGKFWGEFHPHVKEMEGAPRFEISLGTDKESNRELLVLVKSGSPFVQLGRMADNMGKPKFAAVPPRVDPGTITHEQALGLLNSGLPRILGKTKDEQVIEVRGGRYGPYLALMVGEETVDRISLDENQDPYTVTLEDVQVILERPRLPRTLGSSEDGSEFTANKGRFGPYITVVDKEGAKNNFSLRDGDDPWSITLERAIELHEVAKKNPFKRQRKVIKQFNDSEIQILDGRYGPYVTDGKTNATIPKGQIPDELDLAACQKLIEEKAAKQPAKRRKRSPAKRKKVQT